MQKIILLSGLIGFFLTFDAQGYTFDRSKKIFEESLIKNRMQLDKKIKILKNEHLNLTRQLKYTQKKVTELQRKRGTKSKIELLKNQLNEIRQTREIEQKKIEIDYVTNLKKLDELTLEKQGRLK